MKTTWHIIVQTRNGAVYREEVDCPPDSCTVAYYEKHYSDANDYKNFATVVNVFKTEEE